MKIKLYIQLAFVSLFGLLFSTCSEDDLDSQTIFPKTEYVKTEFDKWLDSYYLNPFNIDYKYKMEDIELSFGKHYSPADLGQSMKLAKILKHVWVEAYVEVGGKAFLSKTAPSIIFLHGSGSWNEDGTQTLGTAEGGVKINLFLVNWLEPEDQSLLNSYYLKTMHHEFTHILQQNVNYPLEYNVISEGDYLPTGWYNRKTVKDYASLGFVTSYAGSNPIEDITEVTACYITFSDAEWNSVWQNAGVEGTRKLEKKISIMKQYMKESWNIDMDLLREVVRKRMSEIPQLKLIEDAWLPILDQSPISTLTERKAIEAQLTSEWPNAKNAMNKYPNCCHIHNAALSDRLNINE